MFQIFDKPGLTLNDQELASLHKEVLEVAGECLDEIPFYQCLTGKREEYARLIIAVARSESGKMLGFCSSYLLDGGEHGQILHLGLTCVAPAARRMGLTHRLTSKVVMTFLFRYSLFRTAWITNVACVLSSLGNVALHFEDVYPSPFKSEPSQGHQEIAHLIDQKYRWELFINEGASFDDKKFVFERSVCGTMFEKSESDKKFHHRDQDLTRFYSHLIDFENGDEVLQVGKVSILTFPFYLFKSLKRKLRPARFMEQTQTVA